MPLLNDADAIYRGATTVDRVYRGATLVWEPAAGGPLVSDTFNRADSTTSLGTADTGQVWSALAGTWGIDTNRAYSVGTTPSGRDVAVESAASDVTVSADLVVLDPNTGPGLLFRVVDASNYWIFAAEPAQGRWGCYRQIAGGYNLLGSLSEAPFAGRMSVVCSGATITCKVDGVTKITLTDATHQAATRHGLRDFKGSGTSGTRFDDFRVDAL